MPRGQLLWKEESRAVARRIKDVSEKGVSEEVQFVGQIKGFGRMEGTEAFTMPMSLPIRNWKSRLKP
jgi:hypothetical protein